MSDGNLIVTAETELLTKWNEEVLVNKLLIETTLIDKQEKPKFHTIPTDTVRERFSESAL